ncbi:MAG: hypothetical protein IJL31_00610 [Oscillospiraceae bacterium]|nr:hypothetical protein [Oscillospiraceae bacterium]
MNDELICLYHPAVPPLLAELAATPPMERLKDVGMNCGCEYTALPRFARSGSYSRWLHSLGVGLIVWHFTGDAAQAAAGLLHDIATPTFAHVVDFLRGDYLTQEATEDGTRERIDGSPEIRAVLARCGLTTEAVCDYHRYPIADNDSPRLSADRLEYSLGNALRWGFLSREEIAAIYADLRVGINEAGAPELIFRHPAPAAAFARAALECARVYVSDEDRYAMQALCELIGRAMKCGVLSPADLEGTEPPLIARLEASPLAAEWHAFRAMRRVLRRESSEPPAALCPPDPRPWRRIRAKKRRIDPLTEGLGRVSAWDAAFAEALTAFLSQPQTEWLLAESE